MRRATGSVVETLMPSRQSVVHAATGVKMPSTPTMQTRQAPNGSWRSSKQSVGMMSPRPRAASSTVVPGATSV
jgi:hypothetical protein